MSAQSSSNRWWHIHKADAPPTSVEERPNTKNKTLKSRDSAQLNLTKWQFKVFVNFDLRTNENVSITGDCDQLGKWNPNDSIRLDKIEGRHASLYYCIETIK